MKISKLLVLSALSLMGTSAWADVPDGVWSIPDPSASLEFTEFDVDDMATHVYFYNPAAKMFFASGNDWNTRASIAAFGYEIWCEPSTEEDAPEGSYELWDDCQHPDRVLGYKNMFTDDGGSTWVDHAAQPNYSWTVTKNDGFYRFQNVALVADISSFEGKYLGWKGDYSDTRLYMLAEGEGAIDWKAVSYDSYQAFIESEAYAAYKNGVDCYGIAVKLRENLVEAESLGADISAQLAVYTNTASTPSQLQKAIDDLKPIIDARTALKTALDNAKAKGFTATADYDAVFANANATEAELKKALEDLNSDLVEWGKTSASVENPADMSSKIVNPNFDNASYSGWSGDAPNMTGSGAHGPANVPEKWNATFNTYQDIEGLPAGVYALGAQTMWRGSWNDMKKGVGPASKLYAVVGEKEVSVPFNYAYAPLNTEPLAGDTPWGVGAGEQSYTDEESGNTYYIPNDPSAFRLYAEKGWYDTKVLFGISEGQTLRIGTKNPSMLGDADNWSCWDTFTLTYYGAGADAAQLYLDETLKNYGEKNIEEGTVYTESYLEAYKEALQAEISVSSFEEVATALGEIDAANTAIDTNIALWKKWQEAVEEANNTYVLDDSYSDLVSMDDLSDYVSFEADEILEEHALTNEELEAEIAKLAAMVQAVIDESKEQQHEDGDDMTKYIKNPDFQKGLSGGKAEGWTVDRVDGGNVTPGPIGGDGDTFIEKCGYYNGCFESWHCHDWDVWQEISDLPKGMYELNVQGYVRCEVGGYTRGNDLTDYPSPVYLYMNSATAQFPNVYSQVPADYGIEFQIVEGWTTETINDALFPNSMGGAAQCFNNPDLYKMTAYGLIAKKGDTFRIGVRMKADQDWWCIWDNFKLTYRVPTPEIVKPVLEAELEKLDLSRPMGSNVYEQATVVKADAEAALNSNDGDQMFDALVKVYDLGEAINASVAQFANLNNAVEELFSAIGTSPAADATKSDARTLANTVSDGIANHTYEDAQVEGLVSDIELMVTKLGIPANYPSATDEAPADFTKTIRNPEYDEGNSGWKGTSAAWNGDACDAEIFGQNYDYYQEIVGLPAGTYALEVQAFYRAGAASVDYQTWTESPEENNNAFLYASLIVGSDTATTSKPIARLASEAGYNVGGDGYVTVKEATDEEEGLAVANTMVTAGYEFLDGKYNNSLIFKIEGDCTLRIGLKKEINITDNWTIFDNWKLTYYGTESSKTVDGDPSGIIAVSGKAGKVEFFSLNGARLSKPQKGVALMKRIMSDGTVKVQKVTIK